MLCASFSSRLSISQKRSRNGPRRFAEADKSNHRFDLLKQLYHQLCYPTTHQSFLDAYGRCYAPLRERHRCYDDSVYIASLGNIWFWAAITCAVGIDEKHAGRSFRCDLAAAAANGWHDGSRLHTRLIREAPRRATATPRDQLMAHPLLLRIARLKYQEGSIEQNLVLRFLSARCIKERFSSEEDCFTSDFTLGQWVRDGRAWAEELLQDDPGSCSAMFEEDTEESIQNVRALLRRELGPDPALVDDLDATGALMKWAKRQRRFEFSQDRAQLWEFVVVVSDAALWLGWLFPRSSSQLA